MMIILLLIFLLPFLFCGLSCETFMQRSGKDVLFDRPYQEYVDGFGGDCDEVDCWLGLENIFNYSNSANKKDLVFTAIGFTGLTHVWKYRSFYIDDAASDYTLQFEFGSFEDYANSTAEALEYHRGHKFSAIDYDPESNSCSDNYANSGWWYGNCYHSQPTGYYYDAEDVYDSGSSIYWGGVAGPPIYFKMEMCQLHGHVQGVKTYESSLIEVIQTQSLSPSQTWTIEDEYLKGSDVASDSDATSYLMDGISLARVTFEFENSDTLEKKWYRAADQYADALPPPTCAWGTQEILSVDDFYIVEGYRSVDLGGLCNWNGVSYPDMCGYKFIVNMPYEGRITRFSDIDSEECIGYLGDDVRTWSLAIYSESFVCNGQEFAVIPDDFCSGHGSCVQGSCACTYEYVGDYCETSAICYGIKRNESRNVCSGHGECLDSDNCQCDDGYVGSDCSEINYFTKTKDGMGAGQGGAYNCSGTGQPGGRILMGGDVFGSYGAEFMYIWGGYGYGEVSDALGHLSDLWYYDISSDNWCFVKGSSFVDTLPNTYGSNPLIYDSMHTPGSRSGYAYFSTAFSFLVLGGQRAGPEYSLFSSESGYLDTNELWELQVIGSNRHNWRELFSELLLPSEEEYITQPSPRSHSCAARLNEPINSLSEPLYLFGGGSEGKLLNDLWTFDIPSNQFTKLRGNSNDSFSDIYPSPDPPFLESSYSITPNNFSESLDPVHRYNHLCWVGSDSNFYIFGGTLANDVSVNDIWIFNSTINQWAWISGNFLSISSSNYYSDKFVFDDSNFPSARSSSIKLRKHSSDNQETFFFGGVDVENRIVYADIWSFSDTLWEWKFVNGSEDSNVIGNDVYLESRYSGIASFGVNDNAVYFFGGASVISAI